MIVAPDILITWGGVAKKFRKGDYIFHEGESSRFYFQVLKGTVRVFNTNSDGKEFTHGEFADGESFGEPPLFIDEPYPSTAIASEDSVILKISKEKFLCILSDYPSLQRSFLTLLSRRIYDKSVSTRDIINSSPEKRIMSFLKTYKKKIHKEGEVIEIPFTRQEIANYTGLRVETVIRTLLKMKEEKSVQIVKHKLIY